MIRKLVFSITMALATMVASASVYQVNMQLPMAEDGAMVQLVNYDNGEKVDSATVANGVAVIEGDIESSVIVRAFVDGSRYAQFILEPGTINIDAERNATGAPLNDKLNEIVAQVSVIGNEFQAQTDPQAQEAVYAKYLALVDKTVAENAENPIGLLFFMDLASEMSPEELTATLEQYPAFKSSKRVSDLVEKNIRKAATSVGKKYVDFDINGKKLSDYVGRDGKYLLVDFWASWCGPCIRQTKVLKEIYAQYKDAGLEVLGVAVWDKPEDTLKAIERHDLPWDCIIDAQTIPTDLYGISGIPCIILISPDGTILSRDKQGDELKADVDRYLAK